MEQDIKKNNLNKFFKRENKYFNKYETYILYFFLFAFLGWLLETIYSFIVLGHFTKRGFLFGPICPIYGYGALILIVFLGKYKNNGLKLFTYSAIVFSTFEYLASYVLEVMFNSFWWDYRNDFFNLNGRISIFYALAWGFIAIIFIGHIYPFFKERISKILSKLPFTLSFVMLYLCIGIYIIDTIASCIFNSFL